MLKSALARSEARGWLQQVSGRGFSGSYRLLYPYYPTPAQLWGKDYREEKKPEEETKKKDTSSKGRKRVVEYSEEEDEESEEEEFVPAPKKRGAPKAR